MVQAKKKFAFGSIPKEFVKAVEIIDVDGGAAEIDFTFIYRTRAEFASLVDDNMEAATAAAKDASKEGAKKSPKADERRTITKMYEQIDQSSVDFVLKIASGWDLSDPLDSATLMRLENENPGSLTSIASVYRAACAEVRTKN